MMSIFEDRIKSTGGAFIIVGFFILLEYLKGGVAAHHFLASEELPEISNWWGLLTVPLLTWLVHSLVDRRRKNHSQSNGKLKSANKRILHRFLSGLVFGVAVAILWELDLENVLQYFILLPIVIAALKPVHYSEILLGFVFGMIYTFGGILPIIIGLVLIAISFIVNKFIGLLKKALAGKQD